MEKTDERIIAEHVASIDSTNAELKRRIASGALTGPAALSANEQTAGRGRRGRSWINTEGALMMSYAFPTGSLDPDHIPLVTMAAALAARTAIRRHCENAVIKWPNDIVIRAEKGYKKLSGILSELASAPDGRLFAVIGIGVNVNCGEVPGDLLHPASSIFLETGVKTDLAVIEAELLSALREELDALTADPAALLERYSALCMTIGSEVQAYGLDNIPITGRAVGIDERGRLLIKTEERTVTVGAADVFISVSQN